MRFLQSVCQHGMGVLRQSGSPGMGVLRQSGGASARLHTASQSAGRQNDRFRPHCRWIRRRFEATFRSNWGDGYPAPPSIKWNPPSALGDVVDSVAQHRAAAQVPGNIHEAAGASMWLGIPLPPPHLADGRPPAAAELPLAAHNNTARVMHAESRRLASMLRVWGARNLPLIEQSSLQVN